MAKNTHNVGWSFSNRTIFKPFQSISYTYTCFSAKNCIWSVFFGHLVDSKFGLDNGLNFQLVFCIFVWHDAFFLFPI